MLTSIREVNSSFTPS